MTEANFLVQLKGSSRHLAFNLLQEVEASHHQDLEEGDRYRHWGIDLLADLEWPKVHDAEHYSCDWYSPEGPGHKELHLQAKGPTAGR